MTSELRASDEEIWRCSTGCGRHVFESGIDAMDRDDRVNSVHASLPKVSSKSFHQGLEFAPLRRRVSLISDSVGPLVWVHIHRKD